MTDAARDWSSVAGAWDVATEEVEGHTAAMTEALVDGVAVRAGDRLLELSAGPGALGARWSELVGPSGSVVVSDVAPGMVEAATRRLAGLANVRTAVLDASAIDAADGSFDVVVSRMGLMFTPEPGVALAEIRRVLGAGGRIGVSTWGRVEHNPWMTCVGMAAMMNGLVSGGPPVGPGGIFSLGDPTEVEALAKDAGFVDVRVEEIDVEFRAPDIDAHIARVSSLAGPLAAAFAAATPEQLAGVRRTATDLAARHTDDDGRVALPGRAVVLTARA